MPQHIATSLVLNKASFIRRFEIQSVQGLLTGVVHYEMTMGPDIYRITVPLTEVENIHAFQFYLQNKTYHDTLNIRVQDDNLIIIEDIMAGLLIFAFLDDYDIYAENTPFSKTFKSHKI